MKKVCTVLMVFSLVFIFISSASAISDIKLGTDDWPPYEYTEGGIITGYSTDLILPVLKKMSVKITDLKIYPWARAEQQVFDGEIDALYSSSTSDKRKQFCYFPEEPLISSDWVMFIRKSDEGKLKFDSLNDLKGKRIGVVKEYGYTPEFWDFIKKENNYSEVITDKQNFQKLDSDRVDYVVSEYAVGLALMKELKISDKVIALKKNPIKSTGLYIMFSKKTTTQEFVDKFSQELKQFKSTPEYEKIKDKYLK